jgi:hypothetical protein
MTLKDYHKFTLGTSDNLTRCRVLWGGSEIMNDYFSRLGDIGQNIKIRSARYDEKHDVLTAYASDKGLIEYRNALRHWQHKEGRYNKYDHKKQGGI